MNDTAAGTAAPEHFLNRELSWLEFNRRVLEEAQDASQPLLERVKFLGIFASNLDEFFEIRVAGLKQQIESGAADAGPDGVAAPELFAAIRRTVLPLVAELYRLWREDIEPALAAEGIIIRHAAQLTAAEAAWAADYFGREVFPVLTPLGIDASHPFPVATNKCPYVLLKARRSPGGDPCYGIVQVPRVVPGLIALPTPAGKAGPFRYLYLNSLIKRHIGEVFPGLEIEAAYGFRVTRNSDLYVDEEEAENLLRTIERELRRANRGRAVRLEVERGCPPDLQAWLLEKIQLGEADVYEVDECPISMADLAPLYASEAFARLKDRPFQPVFDPALPPGADFWQVLRREDVLLHHPFETFDTVVQLLDHAAADPRVLAIKMTLYRTSGDSPLIAALANAASNGKQVTALVEIKARFDEANNIQWARRLEEAGVHVLYGIVGLKTHCKLMMIVRRDDDRIRHYVHLGTGNYHPRTARLYTDLSLLTSDGAIAGEVAILFNTLTGLAPYPGHGKLLVAPFDLADRLLEKIARERDLARAGKGGRIIAKVNSLVDERVCQALYAASAAGVEIDLIVRGICCLRPGVPGLSDRIRVVSIVGRFLEHSRIFYFGNGGDPKLYLGSADWMPRNLHRRIEVLFPVEAPALKRELIEEILPAYLNDCVKSRELHGDGRYSRRTPAPGSKPSQAQLFFRELARQRHAIRPAPAPHEQGWLLPLRAPGPA